MNVALTIDTSGTRCPIPLLKAKQGLKTVAVGEHVLVISTDPSSVDDFNAMLRHLPHALVSAERSVSAEGVRQFQFLIQKG